MDIFQYWRPVLIRSQFHQGSLSSPFWEKLIEIVECCHCIRHWREEETRMKRDFHLYKDAGYKRKAKEADTRHFRARWLAGEAFWKLAHLAISEEEKSLVDEMFKRSGLRNTMRSHETADFSFLELESFPGVFET